MSEEHMPPPADTAHSHALAYAALGWRVLPIKPGGKHPPMNSWQHAATDSTKTIDNWFQGLYKTCGVGIAMGRQPNGDTLIAVDVDEHDPAQSGSETIIDLEQQHGPLPATVTAITGSGGKHLVFRLPDGIEPLPNVKLGVGVDTRGQGGQIVVAPTIHPDTGRAYQWEHGYAPWDHEVADAPQWMVDLLTPAPQPSPSPSTTEFVDAETTPADWLRQRWDWHAELTADGWHRDRDSGNDSTWRRPGKPGRTDGISGVLHGTEGPFVIWSTDAEVSAHWSAGTPTRDGNAVSMSPLAFYAARHHQGDVSAASRALREWMGPTVPPISVGVLEDEPAFVDDPWNIIEWPAFWKKDHSSEEWLAEPIIAAKRGHSIVAKGGTGKSLFALWMCAGLATGRPLFRGAQPPIHVLYVDYEMTTDDVFERLENMGYGPGSDLSHLHYSHLPSVGPLDVDVTKGGGGSSLAVLAEQLGASLVVIDTYGRAVQGDENEADTTRAFYRHTAGLLKRLEIAFVRVDHMGKDPTKGARGSSAKNDDVDVVWEMVARDGGALTLKATKRRIAWVPEVVELFQNDDSDLTYQIAEGVMGWPAGTAEVARQLDELGVPTDVRTRDAMDAYREAGFSARSTVIRAAVKYRRGDGDNPVNNSGPKVGPRTGFYSDSEQEADRDPDCKTPASETDPQRDPPGPTDPPCVGPSVGSQRGPTGATVPDSEGENLF